ncbi:hypothetical protein PRIPAC_91901 [Pristionchus pacificus]|uniref:Uncharacterized protein n=1 Tax=Pristionchus pacificus TaxID=54126 RepID=A0A2A6BAC8_PRIPA|nr:hypothetical protein PRIPAC_91901 [Pristionchus pacificus]|eukprot:PDM62839.1 hypothetical protein PRIPAC_50054 [Pristionchus pacificus]
MVRPKGRTMSCERLAQPARLRPFIDRLRPSLRVRLPANRHAVSSMNGLESNIVSPGIELITRCSVTILSSSPHLLWKRIGAGSP